VCLGSAEKPEAEPGNLCVYESLLESNVPREELEVEFLALRSGGNRARDATGTNGTISGYPGCPRESRIRFVGGHG
jgi:hypothetical protein